MILPDDNRLFVMFKTNIDDTGNFLDDLSLLDLDTPSNKYKFGCKAVIDFVVSNCGKTLFIVDDEDAKKNIDIAKR